MVHAPAKKKFILKYITGLVFIYHILIILQRLYVRFRNSPYKTLEKHFCDYSESSAFFTLWISQVA